MDGVKQTVAKLLKRMPDDCTFEDVQYELYVVQTIRKRLAEAKKGRIASPAEVRKRMKRWTTK